MIFHSLLLGALVVILSTLLSLPLAYLFSRTDFARRKYFDLLFLVPFITPPYIASMGWILFMQKRGLFSQIFPAFPQGIPPFFSLGGLVLVMSLHLYPFMLTLMKNAMAHIPSSLEEAAAVMGASLGPHAEDFPSPAFWKLCHRCPSGFRESPVRIRHPLYPGTAHRL